MIEMTIAGLILLVTHFGLSSTSLRPKLVGMVGESGFQGLYSVVAFGALGLCIWVYGNAARTDYFWFPDPDLYTVAKVLMPLATIFAFGGFLAKNPTQVGMERVLEDSSFETHGLLRITRHPFMWGVIIWSVAHLVANGDVVSVVFFLTFGLLAGIGTLLMDRKKAAQLGGAWQPFVAVTSNVPFGAILRGRNKLVPGELVAPVAVGLVTYAAFYFLHQWVSGVAIS